MEDVDIFNGGGRVVHQVCVFVSRAHALISARCHTSCC
jgi:hypothetical protein